jgi:hypothetical protein
VPDGGDGDLTNGWNTPPEPVPFRPPAGRCFDNVDPIAPMATYAPIDCAERHLTETFYVGDLTGAAAAATANRAAEGSSVDGSPAQLAAGLECARRAAAFLGGDWRTAQLAVKPVLPGTAGWTAGSRWFRCDLAQIELGDDRVVGRTGTLKGALTGTAKLRLGCFNPTTAGARVSAMTPVDCARPHHAEFAGLWAPPDATPGLLRDDGKAAAGCRSAIAAYTGVPDDGDLQYRVGWIGFSPTEEDWNAGAREVRCFLWLDEVTMKGSYRAAGPGKLPINYA